VVVSQEKRALAASHAWRLIAPTLKKTLLHITRAVSSATAAVMSRHREAQYSIRRQRRCHRRNPPSPARVDQPGCPFANPYQRGLAGSRRCRSIPSQRCTSIADLRPTAARAPDVACSDLCRTCRQVRWRATRRYQIIGANFMGNIGLEWQVAGFTNHGTEPYDPAQRQRWRIGGLRYQTALRIRRRSATRRSRDLHR
jgi:hypothetical protein